MVRARSLLAKLLAATLAPTVLVLGAFGWLAHEVARRGFEDELGKRLAAAATGVALQLVPFQVQALDPADEASVSYASVRRRLEAARASFGVRRVVLVAPDLSGRGDTEGRIPLGARAHELAADGPELEQALGGRPTASVLFWGADGRPYKRAYAPVGSPAVAAVAVEGSADTFASLVAFRRWFVAAGGVGLAVIVLATSLIARRIARPLGRLARAAEAIGRGDLTKPIVPETADEVGRLATRLDEMRAALQARDERTQMMLAGIAHEVRNPLGGLQLYAGLLRDALADAPDRLDEVARLEREIAYLDRVVNEFLDYARRAPPALEAVPVEPLLHEVAEVGGAGMDVRVETPGLTVRADRGQLRRALLNLVRNAVTAAGPGGAVVLAARADGPGAVVCEVRDGGPGVPAEARARIFEPFFTTREKGTGLGLAFVREIVRDHGGEVDLAPGPAPEGGACFRLRLPAA
jgi:signal transduction histidine kinase